MAFRSNTLVLSFLPSSLSITYISKVCGDLRNTLLSFQCCSRCFGKPSSGHLTVDVHFHRWIDPKYHNLLYCTTHWLFREEEAGVIKRITQPWELVSAKHIMYKPDEKLRICLDPRNLNKAILHEHFKLPTREEVMARMAGTKIFSKLDCSKRFW